MLKDLSSGVFEFLMQQIVQAGAFPFTACFYYVVQSDQYTLEDLVACKEFLLEKGAFVSGEGQGLGKHSFQRTASGMADLDMVVTLHPVSRPLALTSGPWKSDWSIFQYLKVLELNRWHCTPFRISSNFASCLDTYIVVLSTTLCR